jgi:hexosaminidase
VVKRYWQNCPKCRQRVKTLGLANVHELHSDLVRRMARFLATKNRKLIGWDEIMEGRYSTGGTSDLNKMAWDKLTPADMPPNSAVMSWRAFHGPITGVRAAQLGLNVVMSPTSHCYFDYSYTRISTEKTYSYEPIPEQLTPEQARHVLGAQANMWTHIATTEAAVDKQVFPRLLALAEVVWSPKELRDWEDFNRRLKNHYAVWINWACRTPTRSFQSIASLPWRCPAG